MNSDCRSCIYLVLRLNLKTGLVRAHDCNPPERAGEPKNTNGRCVYYKREPGSDDYK